MFVGEGRVGKTALCNSMMGKPFEVTESTVGFNRHVYDVRTSDGTTSKRWVSRKNPDREFEAGVAQIMKEADLKLTEAVEVSESKAIDNESKKVEIDEQHETTGTKNASTPTNSSTRLETRLEVDNETDDRSSSVDMGERPRIDNVDESKDMGERPRNDDVEESRAISDVNENILMQCYADDLVTSNNISLSLFDFGGQSVFNIIHHLFLTSYGVYVLVFNMLDILDEERREQSYAEMSFWIKSFVLHTCGAKGSNSNSDVRAPLFLVGTHKDIVNKRSDHEQISKFLKEKFRRIVGKYIIEYDNNNLYFFPIDNLRGQDDDVVIDMITKIEKFLEAADYVKEPRPLMWLKALDALVDTKESFLKFDATRSIAINNGVMEDSVEAFLSFLNEMGMVLWLNEAGLRHLVILDIMTIFVEPATRVICNHISKPSDSTIHHRTIQMNCEKECAIEWDLMTNRGIVKQLLLNKLLGFKFNNEEVKYNVDDVVELMLKYGLMIRLKDAENHLSADTYLVPALLPDTQIRPCTFRNNWVQYKKQVTCYYVFSTVSEFCSSNCIRKANLEKDGFLPRGLMERLIGKAVVLMHMNIIRDDDHLYHNYAELLFKHQLFRLVCIPEINCIRLDVQGEHPLPVCNRIRDLIGSCIDECMGSLHFETFLRWGSASESEDSFTLVNLRAVRDSSRCVYVEEHPLDRRMFSAWLTNMDRLSAYDVFISYRWDKTEDVIPDQIYKCLQNWAIGSNFRAVQVYLDKVRNKKGRNFRDTFVEALVNSTVVVPIISNSALRKMRNHDPEKEDNVLVEWILALECMKHVDLYKVRVFIQ